jgi:hypothetical protein
MWIAVAILGVILVSFLLIGSQEAAYQDLQSYSKISSYLQNHNKTASYLEPLKLGLEGIRQPVGQGLSLSRLFHRQIHRK